MALDKFLIGYSDENSGQQTNLKPWLISDNAFSQLENAYVWRGRVRKRFGSAWMGANPLNSRLGILIGTTDGSGNGTFECPGIVFEIGQAFSIGSTIFTVYQTGTPAATLSTGAGDATFDTDTGEFVVTGGSPSTATYFYTATPVMGITQYYEPRENTYTTLAFDTQFAYKFDDSLNYWERLDLGESTWTGTNSDFFWSTNYQGATPNVNLLWTTNFTTNDQIRYFDGTTWFQPVLNYTKGALVDTTDSSGDASGTLTGTFFLGQVFTIGTTFFTVIGASGALQVSEGGTGTGTFDIGTGAYTFTGAFASTSIYFSGNNYITTARLIIQFKNRLLLFNTIENVDGINVTYVNRVRYSAIGSPLAPGAWLQDVPGQGNAVDAPTFEAVVTAQFIKDRLIVYFQSSTFELVYTGNQVIPFVWQKINTEFGAESTFSQIPFDKSVFGIGNIGIVACNGSNVERIDQKIPQFVFGIHNENAGVDRVAGIRDYYTELAYWAYPSQNRNSDFYFPDQVLVYNYINDSWAVNDDSFTTFGYYLLNDSQPGMTWRNTTTPWDQNANLWNDTQDGQSTVKFKSVVGGNQEGFVVIIRPDILANAPALQITQLLIYAAGVVTLTIINHNLKLNDFIMLTSVNGIDFTDSSENLLSQVIGRVANDPLINSTPNEVTIFLLDNLDQAITIAGTYTGGGLAARVSQINIQTKQYNFYTSADRNMAVAKIDFLVDKTDIGQVTVDTLASSSSFSFISQAISLGILPGTNVLETAAYDLMPLEKFQTRLWHPIYLYDQGECIQVQIYLSNNQMYSYTLTETGSINFVALQDFQMHAMLFYVQPTSYRMQ